MLLHLQLTFAEHLRSFFQLRNKSALNATVFEQLYGNCFIEETKMSFSAKNVWLSILYSRPYTIGQSKENSKYSEWFVLQCNTENNKSKISWKFSKTRSKILVSIMFHVSKVARKKKVWSVGIKSVITKGENNI